MYKFKFPLDREGTTTSILAPKIKTTWQRFHQSTEKVSSSHNFYTVFTYRITNEKQRNIAKQGIDEFHRLMPYVLAFIPKIEEVIIINGNESIIFKRKPKLLHDFIVQIGKKKNSISCTIQIALLKHHACAVAIEINPKDNSVKELKDIPHLFCGFPLIGTENFHFPVILNSSFFHPQTERDGIWLKGIDDKEVNRNRLILKMAISLYEQLMQKLADLGVTKLYNAVNTKLPTTSEKYFDAVWYKEEIQKPLREKIELLPIVDTIRKGRRPIKDVYFPSGSNKNIREDIWNLGKDLNFLSLPNEISFQGWHKVIWDYKLDYDNFSCLLELYINKINDFSTLYEGDISPFSWLNNYYKSLIENDEKKQFTTCAIVPNQNGQFKKTIDKKYRLFKNEIQDETLIDVLKLLGEDWNEKLIHNEVQANVTSRSFRAKAFTVCYGYPSKVVKLEV